MQPQYITDKWEVLKTKFDRVTTINFFWQNKERQWDLNSWVSSANAYAFTRCSVETQCDHRLLSPGERGMLCRFGRLTRHEVTNNVDVFWQIEERPWNLNSWVSSAILFSAHSDILHSLQRPKSAHTI